jgi:hypothetical protein
MQYGTLFFISGADEVVSKEKAAASSQAYDLHMRAYGFDTRDLPEAKTYLYTGYIRPFHFKRVFTSLFTTLFY